MIKCPSHCRQSVIPDAADDVSEEFSHICSRWQSPPEVSVLWHHMGEPGTPISLPSGCVGNPKLNCELHHGPRSVVSRFEKCQVTPMFPVVQLVPGSRAFESEGAEGRSQVIADESSEGLLGSLATWRNRGRIQPQSFVFSPPLIASVLDCLFADRPRRTDPSSPSLMGIWERLLRIPDHTDNATDCKIGI